MRIEWRNYPLPFHGQAQLAHEAAMEAHAQGKFWQYHDLLFANQRALERENLEQYAQQAGLNMNRFRAALDNHTHAAAIEADKNAIQRAGARIGTPTFFINGKMVSGALPFEQFKAAIDAALAAR